MPQPATRSADSQPLRTRALARAASSVDVESRSFEAVLTTETPVRTWIPLPGTLLGADTCQMIEVDEVLKTDGLDRSRVERMPLLACHHSWSMDDYLGQITEVRAEAVEGLGACVVVAAQFKPSRAEMAADLAAGFYPNVSAGYVVDEYEVSIREGAVPLAEAVRWTLLEGSLVPVGADPNARVRSAQPPNHPLPAVRMRSGMTFPAQDTPTVDLEALLAAAEAAQTAADEAVAALPADFPEGTDAALSTRAAAVRLRALGATTESKAEPKAGEGDETDEEKATAAKAKADKEAADAEKAKDAETADEKAERSAFAAIRAVAQSWGADVLKLADDLAALGTRSSEIRTAVRAEVLKRGASTQSVEVKPAPKQAATEMLDTRALYAALNKR